MSSRWLRLNVDWDDSPWVFTMQAELQLTWIKLLCHVKRDGTGGKVKSLAPLVASRKWGVGEESVVKMLQAGINDGAISIEDGYWVITNWEKYQCVDKTNYERQKRHRAKKRNDNDDNAVTPVVTVARTETETETETETIITPSPPKGAAKETAVEKRGKALAKLLPWPDVEKVCTRYAKHKAELCKSKPWYSTESLSTKAKQLSHLQREEFIALIDKVVTSNWQGIPADFLPSVTGKPPRQRLKGFEPTYSPPKVRIAEPKKPEKATRTPEEMKQIEALRSRVVSKLLATEDPEHEEKVRKQIQEAKGVSRD